MSASDVKILGHIHTWNDEDVIERSLSALAGQSRPLDEILLVDNASTDSTLERRLPESAHVIRNESNLGTSGAVAIGLQYAIDHDYDWVWVFDADTAPRPEALATLLGFYESLPPESQAKVSVLASLPVDVNGELCYGMEFTSKGIQAARPDNGSNVYRFHGGIWTGSLFKVDAVRAIGVPSPDYVLDWGEFEYGYRAMRAGYVAYMHMESIVDHNIGGEPGLKLRPRRVGPLRFSVKELPPIRCYYLVRNLLHFWLYRYHERNLYTLAACSTHVAKFGGSLLLEPVRNRRRLGACLRGARDGVLNRMNERF